MQITTNLMTFVGDIQDGKRLEAVFFSQMFNLFSAVCTKEQREVKTRKMTRKEILDTLLASFHMQIPMIPKASCQTSHCMRDTIPSSTLKTVTSRGMWEMPIT